MKACDVNRPRRAGSGLRHRDDGDIKLGRDLDPDVAAAQVATCARAQDWPVLAAQPARLRVIDPELTVETPPGMP